MSEQLYDVLVAGGGVAGASSVIALCEAGLNVVWISPELDRHKEALGESLAPAANPMLAHLGLNDILTNRRHRQSNATFSAWGTSLLLERNAAVHLEGPGYLLDRNYFNAQIFNRAIECCAERITGCLSQVQIDQGIWLAESDSGKQCQSRFLIDATGRAQTALRNLGQIHTRDHLVSACSFLTQSKDTQVEPTQATLIESVTDGWWYASLLSEGSLVLNYYSDPDLLPNKLSSNLDLWLALINESTHIAHWLEDGEFNVESTPFLASAATRWLEPAAGTQQGADWAAVGDAAAAFDPLSAHGITTALWAATRMPDIAKAQLKGDPQPLQDYARAVQQGIEQFKIQHSQLYARENRFSNSIFWQRRNLT